MLDNYWKHLCDTAKQGASDRLLMYQQKVERVQRDLETFCEQHPPEDVDGLTKRQAQLTELLESWRLSE